MNKILIVGHPQSGHENVERTLGKSGMAKARPSRREGFQPQHISEALARSHAMALHRDSLAVPDQPIHQMQPAPVWHGLALDLMLGNIDQPLWGWSDPDALPWLDFWRGLDPSLQFILVYDRPQSVFTRMPPDALTQGPEALRKHLRHWHRYNAALLRFFRRHPERCLLVHSEQAPLQRGVSTPWLDALRKRVSARWLDRPSDTPSPEAALSVIDALGASWAETDTDWSDASCDGIDPGLLRLIADSFVRLDPYSPVLYAQLQMQANAPAQEGDPRDLETQSALSAWTGLQTLQHRWSDNARERKRLEERVQTQRRLLQRQRARRSLDREAHAQHCDQLMSEIARADHDRQQTLSAQHALQHELREARSHLEAQKVWGVQAQALRQTVADLRRQAEADRQQHARHARESLENLNALAETAGREHQRLQSLLNEALASRDAAAADQQKRLDAMKAEDLATRARLDTEVQELRYALEQARSPAASTVAPARPQAPLHAENAWMLEQLHALQREVERLERELGVDALTQSVAAQASVDTAPARPRFGAAERVREGLDYRIGMAMIQNGRTVSGWFRLPGAVLREMWRHRQRRKLALDIAPSLSEYADLQDAERMRQHLSYRLGQVALRCARNPIGWLRMPFALRREVQAFRKRQALTPIGH